MNHTDTRAASRLRKWRIAVAILALTSLILAPVVWTQRDEIFGETIDPGTPFPAVDELTAEESAFYASVAPRLRSVAAEARALADLGKAKSRNLIELQRRGDRADELGDEIDELAAGGTPARFAVAMQRYEVGIAAVRQAMDDTRSAFASFDWDRVARAVNIMEAGATNLAAASSEIENAAGEAERATPTD